MTFFRRNVPLAAVAVLLLGALLHGNASAQDAGGTLKKIADRNEIVLGYRESSIPFSYLDDDQKPIGYSIDLCLRIVDALRTSLNRPDLKVGYTPVTPATRIPLMANGTIDLECGSTSNTVDRQTQVAFAPTTFVTTTRFVVEEGRRLPHLRGPEGQDDRAPRPARRRSASSTRSTRRKE